MPLCSTRHAEPLHRPQVLLPAHCPQQVRWLLLAPAAAAVGLPLAQVPQLRVYRGELRADPRVLAHLSGAREVQHCTSKDAE